MPASEPPLSASAGVKKVTRLGKVMETHEPLQSRRSTPPLPASDVKHESSTSLRNIDGFPGWRPKSLRKRTFLAFAFVYLGCIVTLAVLFAYSRSHQGVLTVDTRLHYLWTYIPTLFFTIGKLTIHDSIASLALLRHFNHHDTDFLQCSSRRMLG